MLGRSLFVVLEGGEGCGKSTQAKLLGRELVQRGIPSLLVHEPGGTPLGEELRKYLKDPRQKLLSPAAELSLIAAARAQLVAEVIKPALEAGKAVICDRFYPSTVAYQGYGRGIDLALIAQLNALVTQGLKPDLVVLLDLPAEEGLRRRGGNDDRFESEPVEFHRRVHEGYHQIADEESGRWLLIDAHLPEAEIARLVWVKVSQLLEV